MIDFKFERIILFKTLFYTISCEKDAHKLLLLRPNKVSLNLQGGFISWQFQFAEQAVQAYAKAKSESSCF